MKDGKLDILPVAAQADHARVLVTRPRPTDGDMRLNGHSRCRPGLAQRLLQALDERGGVPGAPALDHPNARSRSRSAAHGAQSVMQSMVRARALRRARAHVFLTYRRRCREGEWHEQTGQQWSPDSVGQIKGVARRAPEAQSARGFGAARRIVLRVLCRHRGRMGGADARCRLLGLRYLARTVAIGSSGVSKTGHPFHSRPDMEPDLRGVIE
jgi:hypothetical protein